MSKVQNPESRIQSVDILRTIAIIAVIVIHTTPFELQDSAIGRALDWATVLNQLARFAVPLFFVLSGYFWAGKFKDEKDVFKPTVSMMKKIAILLLFWSAVYLIPMSNFDLLSGGVTGFIKQIYWNILAAEKQPLITLMQGTKVHLWFLVALLCSLAISALLLRFKFKRLLVVVALVLYCIGLAGKAYSDTPLGFHSDFNFRYGPFFSLAFFVTGYFLQRKQPQPRWFPIGCLLVFLGALLHFAELIFLYVGWGTAMVQEYVVGTYFFGVGAALIALSNTKWLRSSRVASIGPLVLGIYASHFIFVELLKPVDLRYPDNAVWDVMYVVVVFLLSYALAWLMSKHRFTKRFVA